MSNPHSIAPPGLGHIADRRAMWRRQAALRVVLRCAALRPSARGRNGDRRWEQGRRVRAVLCRGVGRHEVPEQMLLVVGPCGRLHRLAIRRLVLFNVMGVLRDLSTAAECYS